MGNSEVGHMNLGAGRIVYQDLTRIDAAIEDGSFFDNAELRAACDAAKASGGTLHVMGLLSPGGVHSHENAHLRDARTGQPRRRAASVAVHAFLDGRDTPPRSAEASLQRLQARLRASSATRASPASAAATTRWTATSAGTALRRAWDAIVEARSEHVAADAVGRAAGCLRARRERRVRRADRDRRRARRCATATRWCS